MKTFGKIFLLLLVVSLLAAGCTKTPLYREVPSVPKESYEDLPK